MQRFVSFIERCDEYRTILWIFHIVLRVIWILYIFVALNEMQKHPQYNNAIIQVS